MKAAKKLTARTAAVAGTELPAAFYRLNALLHTIRCIAQHEDQLCVLAHDIKRKGSVSTPTMKELSRLLHELPSTDYADDLQAVENALAQPPASIPPKVVKARKPR